MVYSIKYLILISVASAAKTEKRGAGILSEGSLSDGLCEVHPLGETCATPDTITPSSFVKESALAYGQLVGNSKAALQFWL